MVPGASGNLWVAERRERLGTLPRRLGIGPSTALIVGFIIGSGIFRSPSRVALEAGARVWHCWLGLLVARLRLPARYRWLSLAQCFHVLAAYTSSSTKLMGQRLRS